MDGISPFEYNRLVTGNNFIGRTKEVARLMEVIQNGKNALLYGPPKIGKRSIVYNALLGLERIPYDFTVCRVDFFNIRSIDDMAVKFANELLAVFSTTAYEREDIASNMLPGINMKGSKEPLTEKQLLQIFCLPEKLAQKYNVRLIMYLKQFQDITLFERPAKVFQLLEKCMAKHKMSSYIILGDKRNAMDEIFVKRGYFRNIVVDIPIPQIGKKVFSDYICNSFAKGGKRAEIKQAGAIYDYVEGDPWYTQHLAEICFLLTKDILDQKTVELGFQNLINMHEYELHNTVYSLSRHQMQMIKAILDGVTKFSKSEILDRYGLNSSANVNHLKEALTKKEIVTFVKKGAVEFNDTLLKAWLRDYFFAK
ncbi:MAG: hypothetical protein LKM37_00490 [Bacteroidales bacterium]|jgi:hypothetical protein|nr:hypothetical protein [Bacteroidales bacterium]MCI1733295.1 hypothetical protein [Bacteroidales bacterium]